ncbi:unnamed protein product [Lactuca saligna]|uniref:Cyclin N-terminal domain-containing protein n=1 Tax=Lactuca saligna TaxID=75948 RepID=A0AA35YJB2_LACSI|nr:unnamed protein product [Lactuca saligna]
MNYSSLSLSDMNKENIPVANTNCTTARVTRARAKALGTSGVLLLPPLHPVLKVKKEHKQILQPKTKRASSDNNKSASTDVAPIVQSKRRAVLKEITNNPFNHSSIKLTDAIRLQISNEVKRCTSKKNDRVMMAVAVAPSVCVGPHGKTTTEALIDESIIDIDSKHKGPQMCSLYATEVYSNLRTAELKWRHSVDYMKTVQQEITQEMRSILIDWLVEVCEEYGLASETFYLTVALIDHYLSKKNIGKRRLQLLGITSMLIASKYEEISAPRVEEFCFITDSTYTKGEVLEMEQQILDEISFQLSLPTTKKFLRRFLLAAQSSYKAPIIELEYLANYLAELTLIEYSFLKFLPSLIAASAVFLAKWTLDHDEYPWNGTLEHYTGYKASELEVTVLALQGLQLNNAAPLHAIRQKYKQQKYKSVATLTSRKPVKLVL